MGNFFILRCRCGRPVLRNDPDGSVFLLSYGGMTPEGSLQCKDCGATDRFETESAMRWSISRMEGAATWAGR